MQLLQSTRKHVRASPNWIWSNFRLVEKVHAQVFLTSQIQSRSELVRHSVKTNMLFILPQLTSRAKIVIRTFVPIGQKHKPTDTNATLVFVKVSEFIT